MFGVRACVSILFICTISISILCVSLTGDDNLDVKMGELQIQLLNLAAM